MSRRSTALALVAAFLVPTLLLGWIGLGSLREETKRGAERYRAQAETIAQAVETEVARSLGLLRDAHGELDPLALSFGLDGSWQGETLEDARPRVDGDSLTFAAVSRETDRLQAQGDAESAVAYLQDASAKTEDAELIAWTLDTRAAFLDQLGRRDEARATRSDLIARFPLARNASGLVRAFAARRALADAQSDPLAVLIELYADASVDDTTPEQAATAEFLRQLRLDLEARIPATDPHRAALEAVDRADASRARLCAWLATLREGPSDWVARGAPGGSALFDARRSSIPSANPRSIDAPLDPARPGDGRFVVAIARAGEGWKGGALELDLVFERARETAAQDPATKSLGFLPAIGRTQESAADASARLELAPPLDDYAILVRGGDMAHFVAGERRRFALVAGLVLLAILTAGIAGWLSLRAIAREVEAARGREAFVAAVTHELKTPLAAIRLFAEMLEHGDVEPAKVREFGARTVHESDRLARLVDSVLDLARIEHTGTLAAKSDVDLALVCAAAIRIVEDVARERGFSIVLRPGASLVHVRGDAEALTRALVNLLDNALKHADHPHTIEVEISRIGEQQVELAVLDRGRGVPETERSRIFEAFRRVGSEMTRDRPGVGLGLALVARIAASHGGRAVCEPRDGGGSRFALILPIAREGIA
ncbi:MAG: HAMP domain-containing sensor histidine kinase [Planctomycetota bacterium]